MANWENQLITAIVRGGEEAPKMFRRAGEQGVDESRLSSSAARVIWKKIEAHYGRPDNWGHIPSETRIKEWGNNFEFTTPVENFDDICGKVREGYLRKRGDDLINAYLENASVNVEGALETLQIGARSLSETVALTRDVSFKEVGLSQMTAILHKVKQNDGLTGFPWPWAPLNMATGGIQPGDYIMVWATPKSCKTWFGLLVALNLYMRGLKVLVYSKEMTWKTLLQRICCILARVDYGRLKKGKLSPEEEMHFLTAVEQFTSADHPGELIYTSADRASGAVGGPDEIQEKVELHRPDFVFLDSAYMLELPGTNANPLDWKSLSVVNRRLKAIFKNTGIPGLALFQENEVQGYKYRKTRGTASLAMNKGAVMDCDLGIHLVMHQKKQELSIHYAAAREIHGKGFTIHARPCENWGYAHDHLHSLGDDAEEEPQQQATQQPQEAAQAEAQPQHASMIDMWRNRTEPELETANREAVDETEEDLPGDAEQE